MLLGGACGKKAYIRNIYKNARNVVYSKGMLLKSCTFETGRK